MLNHRSLTIEECRDLDNLMHEAGAVEVIRQVACHVGHNIPDVSLADMHRARLMRVAREIFMLPEPEGTKS